MARRILVFLAFAAIARAQIPSLGFCPDYVPMTNFDMEKFAGIWYEAERYFQFAEVASRCVMSNYTKGLDGKFRVSNEVTSRLTGIKRVIEGEIRLPVNQKDGKLHVKYTAVPFINPETSYSILETDYDNYAVLWSCSGVGPVNTQSAWIMTRQRAAPGEILQKAYGVLDKYRISKLYFVKTSQDDCSYLDHLATPTKAKPQTPAPPPAANVQQNQVTRADEELPQQDVVQVEEEEEVKDAQQVARDASGIPQPVPVAVPVEEVKTVPEVIMEIAEKVVENADPVIAKNAVAEEPKVEPTKAPEPVIHEHIHHEHVHPHHPEHHEHHHA